MKEIVRAEGRPLLLIGTSNAARTGTRQLEGGRKSPVSSAELEREGAQMTHPSSRSANLPDVLRLGGRSGLEWVDGPS